jgi:hypothetical protein
MRVTFGSGAVTPASGESLDAAGAFAQLVVGTSTLSGSTGVLATFALQYPSFSYSGRIATLLGVPLSTAASAGGAAAKADLRDKNGVTIVPGLTVGVAGSGADIIIDSTTITSGGPVTCTGGSFTG